MDLVSLFVGRRDRVVERGGGTNFSLSSRARYARACPNTLGGSGVGRRSRVCAGYFCGGWFRLGWLERAFTAVWLDRARSIPITFALAMTRYGLWEIRSAVEPRPVYGLMTMILLVVYVVLVAVLSQLFRGTNNFIVAAVATGIVALLFQPLRDRIQQGINRLMYGERDDPFRVLNRLGEQLEHSLATDVALAAIVETIVKNLRVPYAKITLITDGKSQTTNGTLSNVRRGRNDGKFGLAPTPLSKRNYRRIGLCTPGTEREFFIRRPGVRSKIWHGRQERQPIRRVRAPIATIAERIIVEREQERRRLRRDLHDGLGPTLASQTLKLDAAIEWLTGIAGIRRACATY